MPTKNVLLAVSAVLVAVALVLGGVYMLRPTEATTDSSCQAVGKLLKYSNDEMARIQKHNEKVAETRDAERQDEAIPMYQKWAATIRITPSRSLTRKSKVSRCRWLTPRTRLPSGRFNF